MQLITGIEKLDKSLFNSIKNQCFKPDGGLWSSTYTPGNKHKSDWINWCKDENFVKHDLNSGILFEFKKDTKFYEINSNKDIINLYKIVGKMPGEEYSKLKTLNFENLAKQFDVLHLTKKGIYDIRFGFLNIDNKDTFFYNTSFYGWDCESSLILSFDCIDLNSIKYFKYDNYDCFNDIDTLEQMKICHKCINKSNCNLIAIKESI